MIRFEAAWGKLLAVAQLAERLGICPTSVYRWIS
jgi:transposase-like protein